MEPDVSTLRKSGHFYFALTRNGTQGTAIRNKAARNKNSSSGITMGSGCTPRWTTCSGGIRTTSGTSGENQLFQIHIPRLI